MINTESDVWKINEKMIQLNVLRGRGIFCRLIMDNSLYSNQNKCHFATLVALINVHVSIKVFSFEMISKIYALT